MKRITLVILFIALFTGFAMSSGNLKHGKNIIYLSKGKIYSYDLNKKETTKFIPIDDSIEYFSVSPNHHNIAYTKVVKYIDSPGIYQTAPPKMAVCSIVVYDLINKKTIKEILPKENEFLTIEKWISNDELLYSSASAFAVNGWSTYKINGETENLFYSEKAKEARSVVFSKDYSTKFYVDSLNNIHIFDLNKNDDKKLIQTKNQIYDIEYSYNKKYVAWFEIIDDYNKNSGKTLTIDRIHLMTLENGNQVEIYNEHASRKGAVKCMNFSPNDTTISVELDTNLFLINIFTKEKTLINGNNICWIDEGKFICSNSNNLYLYDVREKKNELFCKDACFAILIE